MNTHSGSKLCQPRLSTATRSLKMTNPADKILIKGLTKDGKKFRPSDWAERLTGAVATFGRGRRIIFHPNVRMVTIDSICCVEIDVELENSDPLLFGFLMKFGEGNNLQISREPIYATS